jgi:hypothetical protein
MRLLHPSFKPTNVKFRLNTVYGSPYDEEKEAFILGLHSLFIHNEIPNLIVEIST